MTLYTYARLFHFLGIIALFSAFSIQHRAAGLFRKATTQPAAQAALALLRSMQPAFIAGATFLLVSGFYMASQMDPAPVFVPVGLFSLLVILIVHVTWFRSRMKRLARLLNIPDNLAASRRAAAPAWAWLMGATALALGVLVIMVLKPTLLGAVLITLGAFAAATIAGAAAARRAPATPSKV